MQPKLILVLVQELATELIMVLAAELVTVPGYYVLQDLMTQMMRCLAVIRAD